ncbi:MAG: biotin/lipoyl-binding protein, partial [Desulfuromonadales bacterium]|nr:biotin/lipoyl-binding protein [Desulfuromonadales bacterium]
MKKLLRKIFPSSELDSDLQFMSEVDAATHKMGSKFAYITSVVIFMLIIVALLWARFAVIDEVTRGVGQIVPSQKVQVIQNLEGGIVEAILVADNQIVDKGDVLLRINNTLAASHYRDTVNKVMEHRAIIIRLLAEAADEELVFPEESDIPLATINSQKEIYQARKEQVQSELT